MKIEQRNPFLVWLNTNFFSSKFNIALTLISLLLLWQVIPQFFNWAVVDASFGGDSVEICKEINEKGEKVDASGACWTFVKVRAPQFFFGLWFTQNSDQIWRPVTAFLLLGALLFLLNTNFLNVAKKRILAIVTLLFFPFIAFALLNGSWIGLPEAKPEDWGGLTLTLVLATFGIAAALPIGIILALARRSDLPIVKVIAVVWIELFRGTPLITILFFASVMLPLFFPEGVSIDKVLRAMVGITLFQSAYTAEAIRGSLNAIPVGQYEASAALGMGYWKRTWYVILPQALKISIPSVVNSFIELYKDTSLVLVIGLLDLLNTVTIASRSNEWRGYELEGYLFAAMLYFIACYSMSLYSQTLERRFDRTNAGNKMVQN